MDSSHRHGLMDRDDREIDRKGSSTPKHRFVAFSMPGGQIFLLASSTGMWFVAHIQAGCVGGCCTTSNGVDCRGSYTYL
jgi:hypothetical protein